MAVSKKQRNRIVTERGDYGYQFKCFICFDDLPLWGCQDGIYPVNGLKYENCDHDGCRHYKFWFNETRRKPKKSNRHGLLVDEDAWIIPHGKCEYKISADVLYSCNGYCRKIYNWWMIGKGERLARIYKGIDFHKLPYEKCGVFILARYLEWLAELIKRTRKRGLKMNAEKKEKKELVKSDQGTETKPMRRTSCGLRNVLFDEIDALRGGESNPARARSIAMLPNTALKSVEVEIEFHKYVSDVSKFQGGVDIRETKRLGLRHGRQQQAECTDNNHEHTNH